MLLFLFWKNSVLSFIWNDQLEVMWKLKGHKEFFLCVCVCVEEREHVEGVVITYKAKTSKSIGLCGGSESLAILVDENFLIWNFKKGCSYAFVSEMLLISRFACNMNDVC